MASRNSSLSPWIVLGVVVLLCVIYYLSRWQYTYYEGDRVRVDRLTGETERRVDRGNDDPDWVPMPFVKHGKSVNE
jgi:hypothetical protein